MFYFLTLKEISMFFVWRKRKKMSPVLFKQEKWKEMDAQRKTFENTLICTDLLFYDGKCELSKKKLKFGINPKLTYPDIILMNELWYIQLVWVYLCVQILNTIETVDFTLDVWSCKGGEKPCGKLSTEAVMWLITSFFSLYCVWTCTQI